MTNKYYVDDWNGVKHTRTSKNRTYTHTVLFQYSPEYDLREAERLDPNGLDSSNYDYLIRMAEGNHPYGKPNQRQLDEAKAAACLSKDEYCRSERDKRVRRHNARRAEGYYNEWGNAGWCGRRDLAEKLLAKYTGERYSRAVIKNVAKLEK